MRSHLLLLRPKLAVVLRGVVTAHQHVPAELAAKDSLQLLKDQNRFISKADQNWWSRRCGSSTQSQNCRRTALHATCLIWLCIRNGTLRRTKTWIIPASAEEIIRVHDSPAKRIGYASSRFLSGNFIDVVGTLNVNRNCWRGILGPHVLRKMRCFRYLLLDFFRKVNDNMHSLMRCFSIKDHAKLNEKRAAIPQTQIERQQRQRHGPHVRCVQDHGLTAVGRCRPVLCRLPRRIRARVVVEAGAGRRNLELLRLQG